MSETSSPAPTEVPTPAPAPESTPTPPPATTTPSTPKKSGNKGAMIIVIIIAVLVALGFAGKYVLGRFVYNKIGENIAEKALESATGGKVDVDSNGESVKVTTKDGTVSTGSNAKWPSDMPSSVPEFTYGTVSYSAKSDTATYLGWSVTYSGVIADALTKYKANLTAKGWTITDTVETSVVSTIAATNGNYQLNCTVDPSSNGATVVVTDTTRQ